MGLCDFEDTKAHHSATTKIDKLPNKVCPRSDSAGIKTCWGTNWRMYQESSPTSVYDGKILEHSWGTCKDWTWEGGGHRWWTQLHWKENICMRNIS